MVARQSETPGLAARAIADGRFRIGDSRRAGLSSSAPNKANFGVFSVEKGHSGGRQSQKGSAGRESVHEVPHARRDTLHEMRAIALSSFVQNEPNFWRGQDPSNLRTFIRLRQCESFGRAATQSQSKPICGGRPAAMDGRALVGYNGQRCGWGAGAKDRWGQRECLR